VVRAPGRRRLLHAVDGALLPPGESVGHRFVWRLLLTGKLGLLVPYPRRPGAGARWLPGVRRGRAASTLAFQTAGARFREAAVS
jgi:hypothetical protein